LNDCSKNPLADVTLKLAVCVFNKPINWHVKAIAAVIRGGSWNNGADAGPFAANLNNAPSNTNSNIGFRCCSGPIASLMENLTCSNSPPTLTRYGFSRK